VRWVRRAESAVAVLCRIAVGLAALQLMAIFGLISYAVAMRYLVGLPQPWIDEAAGWLLVGSVMLAIPEVQRRGDHIGIDFLARKLGPRRSRALLVFAVLTVLASAAVFVREGIVMVEFSRMLNVLSNRLPDVPLWMVQSLVPAGFALLALVALVQLACLLLGLKPRDMAEAAEGGG
jgi:TRAP-type C4-dicarboxylate transport system permease small subunit